jgi:hypothetical protein
MGVCVVEYVCVWVSACVCKCVYVCICVATPYIVIPDALSSASGMDFSALDRDNDITSWHKCSVDYYNNGGWWYKACGTHSFTSLYNEHTYQKSITWDQTHYDISYAEIRVKVL